MSQEHTIHKDVTIRRDVDNYVTIDTYNRRQMWKMLAIVFGIQLFILLSIVVTAVIMVKCS